MTDYTLLVLFFGFVFGTIVGSFINVLIYRSRSGVSLGGRSKCLSCAKTLKPRMLVPLFSYLFQWGKCAFCGTKISLQYPFVEALLGVLYVAVLMVHQFDPMLVTPRAALLMLLDASIWTTLLAITVYDLRHKIIPDSFSLVFALLAGGALLAKSLLGVTVVSSVAQGALGMLPAWIDLAAAPLLALPFAMLWFFSGGRAMGLGDAKLVFGLGWFLGFAHGITAIIFAFWIAFFPSLFFLLMRRKQFTMKSEIPFAPFLVMGALVVYLCNINLLAWTF